MSYVYQLLSNAIQIILFIKLYMDISFDGAGYQTLLLKSLVVMTCFIGFHDSFYHYSALLPIIAGYQLSPDRIKMYITWQTVTSKYLKYSKVELSPM